MVRHWLSIMLAGLALVAANAHAEVPLRWYSTGHVVVPAFVNGHGPFDFILDTGADESAVYAWFAQSLHHPPGKSGVLSGATGSQPMHFTKLSTLAVDGHVITHVLADTIPDRPDGAKPAGVAGADLMSGQLLTLDFGCGTAALLPLGNTSAAVIGANAVRVKAGSIPSGKQLTLPVTLNGVMGVATLDTGARVTSLNHLFAVAAKVDFNSDAFRGNVPIHGATGTPVMAREGPIGVVGFAGITRPGARARVVDLPYLEDSGLAGKPAMNLGVDLLRGTRLTVDYSARQFWLAPSACASP
jgi:predicted aspartyl protease